jgi:hypothetical protein
MAATYERIRLLLLLVLASGELILGGVAAYTSALTRLSSAADAWTSLDWDWGISAAVLGLISGLIMVVSSQPTGSRLSILDRVFEWIVWLVAAVIVISGAALVLQPLGVPLEATACAGVGVFLLCLCFVRPMFAKTGWWKQIIWAALGAGIGAIAAELVLWGALFLSRSRLGPETGPGVLVVILAPAPIGLLLGGVLGFALSRVFEKRGK